MSEFCGYIGNNTNEESKDIIKQFLKWHKLETILGIGKEFESEQYSEDFVDSYTGYDICLAGDCVDYEENIGVANVENEKQLLHIFKDEKQSDEIKIKSVYGGENGAIDFTGASAVIHLQENKEKHLWIFRGQQVAINLVDARNANGLIFYTTVESNAKKLCNLFAIDSFITIPKPFVFNFQLLNKEILHTKYSIGETEITK